MLWFSLRSALQNWTCADLQEPAQPTKELITKEFIEFFIPSIQIELDPSDKDLVTHVYIRGLHDTLSFLCRVY